MSIGGKYRLKRLRELVAKVFHSEREPLHKQRSCERKVCYSKESAIRAASHMQDKTGDEFDVYECQTWQYWHIGHSTAIRVTVESRHL